MNCSRDLVERISEFLIGVRFLDKYAHLNRTVEFVFLRGHDGFADASPSMIVMPNPSKRGL